MSELLVENEDGISIIFYLQKIYPGTVPFLNVHLLANIPVRGMEWIAV
jgi:hypothetical protein